MKKILPWLGGMLVVQVALVLALFVGEDQKDAADHAEQLVDIADSVIDEIVITDGEANSVLIANTDGRWQLPESQNLIVNGSSVEYLLGRITGLNRHWPVTRTSETFNRFKVSDTSFERKLQLKSKGDDVATLYFGTSPAFKKVHARVDNEEVTYSVEMNNTELMSDASDWFDKTSLAVKDEITEISYGAVELLKDGKWTLKDLQPGEEFAYKAVDKYIEYLQTFSVEKITDKEVWDKVNEDEPVKTLTLVAEQNTINLYAYREHDKYIVKSSLIDLPFSVAKYQYNRLFEIKREDFVVQPQEDGAVKDTTEISDFVSKKEG